ncbi:Na-translocating system protein MpsC family protein [Bacillus sp. FJAT-29937]|uniref:Na-translocating system protein MpsC family protein n=1 Tax=Bacillus sp. FJAT-29937 TaxID=1720553 RepID=UPI00082E7C7C|nr:Na-translocating system protein MpsC family protein [Bacillus sp. FJAT-29937]
MSIISIHTHQSLKKDIAHLYNRVNQEIHGVGVKKQRIEIFDDRVIIFAQHKRVQSLQMLSKNFHHLTISVDSALSVEFKSLFKDQIEEMLHFKVKTILKDYDPVTEEACTIIYFIE